MCVIIHKPQNTEFCEKDLRTAYDNNEDGFGYMYYDPDLKKIVAKKSLNFDAERIVKTIKRLEPYDACFHYRYKTVGEITNAQCHPFQVLKKKKHGIDMYFMHNGTIRNVTPRKGESDTQAFNNQILKPILSKAPKLIETEAFKEIISNYISTGSKLCFMYSNGRVVKINEKQGSERHNCWVSNTYSFNNNHRKVTNSTYSGNYRSKWSSGTKKLTTSVEKTKPKTGTLIKSEVKVGDKVNVWHHSDDAFYTMGTIEEINSSCTYVSFEGLHKQSQRLAFHNSDGHSYLRKGVSYYVVPQFESDSEVNTTIKQKKEEKGSTTAKTNSGGVEKKENRNVLSLADKRSEKDKEEVSKSTQLEDVEDFEEYCQVSYGGFSADPYDRQFFFDDNIEDYTYDGHTFEDFNSLEPQERFEFYIKNPDVCFNMLQDLIEDICLQNEEFYETFKYDEDIATDSPIKQTVN